LRRISRVHPYPGCFILECIERDVSDSNMAFPHLELPLETTYPILALRLDRQDLMGRSNAETSLVLANGGADGSYVL
jgi:hypothetical protein